MYSPYKSGVSVTLLQSFQACREMTRLKYICGMKPPRKSVFLVGDIYHQALSFVIKNRLKGAEKAVSLFIQENSAKLYKEAGPYERDMVDETLGNVSVIMPLYFKRWKNDLFLNYVMNEDGFCIDFKMIDGKVVPFRGKVDCAYMTKSGVVVKESKFKSKIMEGFEDTLGLDLQVNSYIYAISEKFPGSTLKCVFDVVRKPSIKIKKGESRKQFLERLKADVESRLDWYFNRTEVIMSVDEVKFARERMRTLTCQFYSWWKTATDELKKKDAGLNSGSCENKFGMCDFVPLCHRGETYGYTKYQKPG